MRKLPIVLAIVLGAVLAVVIFTSVSWADSPMAKSLYRGKHWTPTLAEKSGRRSCIVVRFNCLAKILRRARQVLFSSLTRSGARASST